MAEFNVTIKGRLQAKNFDSAQKKMEELKARVGKLVEAFEWDLDGKKKTVKASTDED